MIFKTEKLSCLHLINKKSKEQNKPLIINKASVLNEQTFMKLIQGLFGTKLTLNN